jgi:ActR/RegA family two-component response regulator
MKPMPLSSTTATARKPDLLIVDDDPLISQTLNFVLSREINIRLADCRNQARRVLRQMDTPPSSALAELGPPPRTIPMRGFS